jgi:hypothetical protein
LIMETKKVRRAIIAAAGFGTRFLGWTKSMPKEMLPLGTKPIIQYVVEELVSAGIEEIYIIGSSNKRAIEDHFDMPNSDLLENLRAGGVKKLPYIEKIESIANLADFNYKRQKGPYGNATPITTAAGNIGDEPFIYTFADDFFKSNNGKGRTKQMIETYEELGGSVLACKKITDDTTAFKNAVVDAINKKTSLLLSGTVYVKDTINVTCDIIGQNATIVTDGSSTFDVLLVDSKQHLNIDNIKFVKKGTSIKRGNAVKITGNAANVAVTNIDADSYNSAVVLLSDADATLNTIYKFIISKTATSGDFKIGFVNPNVLGQTIWTAAIAYNATLAQIQNAIDAAIGSGNNVVTQDSDTMYRIEFIGAWAGLPVASPQFYLNLSNAVQSGGWVTLVQKGGAKYLRNITLDRCVAKNSGEYGFNLGHVDNVLINNCESYFAYYDGIKFTKHVKNTRIIGGNYCYNGLSFLETGTNQRNGDGIDMYAGGEQVKVIGANCSFNSGVGVQLKNDDNTDLTGYASGKLGMCRDVEFIGMTAENNNIGGISITINKSANTSYSVTDVTITGGRYNKNGVYGIAVNGGQRIILNSTNTNKNGSVGISVYATSKHVDINNCAANANGGGTGTGTGLIIAGKNVTVNGGNYCGVDTDALNFDTDLSTLTKYHLANIRVDNTASDVFINLPNERYNSSGRGIIVNGKPNNIKIWQKPTESLIAGSNLVYGSVGSLLFKQDATQAADQLAIKVSGAVDEVGAWRKIGGDTVAEYYTDTVLTGNANVIVARAASADITLTLPLVANQVGMQYTFTKITNNSTYKVKIAAQGTDTINGSTTLPVSLVDYMDSVTLIGTSTGWRVLRKVGANITGV